TLGWTRLRGPSERHEVSPSFAGMAQNRAVSLTLARGARYTSRAGMARAQLDKAGALLVASLLLVGTAATEVHSACNATCQRDLARCMATQCAGIGQGACRRRCKPARIRTLAYAESECIRDKAGSVVTRQALRIRRGDRDPITAVELPPSEPMADPRLLCLDYGLTLWGSSSVAVFPL